MPVHLKRISLEFEYLLTKPEFQVHFSGKRRQLMATKFLEMPSDTIHLQLAFKGLVIQDLATERCDKPLLSAAFADETQMALRLLRSKRRAWRSVVVISTTRVRMYVSAI